MASRTVTIRTDDMTGETEGVEEVSFSVNGTRYAIDLSKESRDRLDEALAPFVAVAARSRPAKGASRRSDAPAIRAWAAEHGIEVAPRGRIPATIVERYKAAH